MTKSEAHAILDKIRDGMSVVGATEALERTGDIQRLPSQPLRIDGHECWNDRPFENDSQTVGERFSWSRYLDCKTN